MNEICGEKIRLYAKQLHLPSIARYADIIRQLPPDAGYDELLERLLRKELDERYVTGQKRRLSKVEKNLKKADLLIIDELSYLTFNRTQSELLFQVITERSERASVIITTNLEFSGWIQLFENEMMLAALVDRVTFHAHILNMNTADGDVSYRLASSLGQSVGTV